MGALLAAELRPWDTWASETESCAEREDQEGKVERVLDCLSVIEVRVLFSPSTKVCLAPSHRYHWYYRSDSMDVGMWCF